MTETFTTHWVGQDIDLTFPFIELDSCDLIGLGHQDKAEFAKNVEAWYAIFAEETVEVTERDVRHVFATVDDYKDDWFVSWSSVETEGSFAATVVSL